VRPRIVATLTCGEFARVQVSDICRAPDALRERDAGVRLLLPGSWSALLRERLQDSSNIGRDCSAVVSLSDPLRFLGHGMPRITVHHSLCIRSGFEKGNCGGDCRSHGGVSRERSGSANSSVGIERCEVLPTRVRGGLRKVRGYCGVRGMEQWNEAGLPVEARVGNAAV
jgi:hypothetical protein